MDYGDGVDVIADFQTTGSVVVVNVGVVSTCLFDGSVNPPLMVGETCVFYGS
jgi:hypothetical protein